MTELTDRRLVSGPLEQVTLDLNRGAVVVHTLEGEDLVMDVGEHREEVLRRLLERGLSPTALRVLLPDWDPLIERVTDDPATPPVGADERNGS